MQITRHISPLRTLAQIIFVAIPTIAILYFLFWNVTNYFTILKNQNVQHTIYCGVGLLSAMFFYAFRFRFITTTPLLFFGIYLIYKSLDKWGANWGEFDAFFYTMQFMIFGLLFGLGWLIGWAFQRLQYFHFIVSGLLLLASIYVIARTGGFDYLRFATIFTPVIMYSMYIIFTVESLKNVDDTNGRFWKRFTLRLLGFMSILLLSIGIIVLALRTEIEAKIAETNGKGKQGGNATSQQDKDGNTQMNDAMSMSGKNSKNHELLFCAHIENFFDGTSEPNPLYLTSYHYTKFDTLSETFERDSTMPSNDEFLPKVGDMPLFSVATDSSRLRNAKSNKLRELKEVEIYNKQLSKNTFLAPSTSFQVQPITVDKNFRKEFKSAYRAKSMVSKLNSAYFIYNIKDPNLEAFQAMRFNTLRKAKNYIGIDTSFMKYYTHFPAMNGKYARIKKLGDSLAIGKTNTIDKVLAVRDYFLQRNILGEQVYKYTDNPGVPGMPSASKLCYFLFDTKKGYCAYYSGATLFLLRSMGIPCRITVGFLTENRASKNPGWYWFYANQSHAWIEVYFPEYGWIDFDTTVGNDESRGASSPDGTPPSPPAKAPLAMHGKAINIDTVKKMLTLRLDNITFKDKVHEANAIDVSIDGNKANVLKDTIVLRFNNIKKGDDLICVSYDNKLYNINGNTSKNILGQIKTPIAIDDIYINDISDAKKENKKQEQEEKHLSAWQIMARVFGIILLLLALLFALPSLVRIFLLNRTNQKNIAKKLNATNTYTNFYLHQLGFSRNTETPFSYSKNIDAQFDIQYNAFTNRYLSLKYSDAKPVENDAKLADKFLNTMHAKIKNKIPFGTRIKKMMQPITTINYLISQSTWNNK